MAKKLTSAKAKKILHDKSVHGKPLTDKQRKFFGAVASGVIKAQNGIEGTMGGLTDQGFDYNGAWGGTMQMGGSLPGSVGFMYARTQSPAPSNGPYAKKTKPSAQNGMEMKYWQEGLDFKPKTISENGSWLEKYQPGGIVPLKQLMQEENKKLKGKADATKVASKSAPKKVIGSPYRDQGTISVPYERSTREQMIADLKQYDDPVRSLVTSPVISALNLLRPDRYFENVRTESDIPGVLFNAGLDMVNAIPVAVPLDEALGVVNQYVPLHPSQLASDLNDLRRVAFPPKPTFANAQTQELLSNVRNVGILSKTGATNAEVLEKVLKKAEGLSPVQFKNLTGFSKDDILERIKGLKENPQGKKPTTVTDEVILHRDTDMGYEFYRDATGEVRSRPMEMTRASQEQQLPFFNTNQTLSREAQERISREIDSEMATLSGRRQSRTLIPERENIVSTEQMSPERIAELDRIISRGSWGAEYSDAVLTADPFGLRTKNPFTDKNLIRRATNFISDKKYMEKTPSFESESLIGNLARTDTNNPATEMLRAYKRVKEAPKGSKFKSSGSLSTDSYPATLQLSKKALQEGIVDINYTGMEGLNTMGFSQRALLPSEYNIGEINNMIKELNQYLPKKLPYAYKSESKGIVAPQISVTKKKNGGWLQKYQNGTVIEDSLGQWAHPGQITKIPSNEITMQGVNYPVLGISDTGDIQMMQPGQDYTFDGNSVTEIPMMQKGGKLKKFVTDIGTAMSTAINPAMGVANMVEPAADLLASTLMPYDTVEQREDIFRRYRPIEYPGFVNITRGLLYPDEQGKPGKDPEKDLNLGEEAWRKALDLPTKQKYIVPSKYKPSTAKNKNEKYYTLNDVIDPEKLIAEAKKRGWKPGAEYQMESLKPFIKDKRFSWDTDFADIDPLQRFKMSIDPKGEYVSIYDVYDFDFPGINKMIKPFEFYDRFYPKKVKIYENKENGGWLSKYE